MAARQRGPSPGRHSSPGIRPQSGRLALRQRKGIAAAGRRAAGDPIPERRDQRAEQQSGLQLEVNRIPAPELGAEVLIHTRAY